MQGELTHHLGYAKHDALATTAAIAQRRHAENLAGEFGEIELGDARDGTASSRRKIVQKNQTRWTGFGRQDPVDVMRGMS